MYVTATAWRRSHLFLCDMLFKRIENNIKRGGLFGASNRVYVRLREVRCLCAQVVHTYILVRETRTQTPSYRWDPFLVSLELNRLLWQLLVQTDA